MAGAPPSNSNFPAIVELNVGGVFYSTSISTLTSEPGSKLAKTFGSEASPETVLKDSKGKYFIDRDGVLFRYILDYLRNKKLVLPENFQESKRLATEADFYELPTLASQLRVPLTLPNCTISEDTTVSTLHPPGYTNSHNPHPKLTEKRSSASSVSATTPTSPRRPCATDLTGLEGAAGTIVIGYRGTFAFGKDGLSDVKFRKLTRILVHGKVMLCREVFGDTLNESRDPDRGGTMDRYTSRFFLKHTSLEQAFDSLLDAGFYLGGCCGTGTATSATGQELKPGMDSEENRWNHYNEFIFIRQ